MAIHIGASTVDEAEFNSRTSLLITTMQNCFKLLHN